MRDHASPFHDPRLCLRSLTSVSADRQSVHRSYARWSSSRASPPPHRRQRGRGHSARTPYNARTPSPSRDRPPYRHVAGTPDRGLSCRSRSGMSSAGPLALLSRACNSYSLTPTSRAMRRSSSGGQAASSANDLRRCCKRCQASLSFTKVSVALIGLFLFRGSVGCRDEFTLPVGADAAAEEIGAVTEWRRLRARRRVSKPIVALALAVAGNAPGAGFVPSCAAVETRNCRRVTPTRSIIWSISSDCRRTRSSIGRE